MRRGIAVAAASILGDRLVDTVPAGEDTTVAAVSFRADTMVAAVLVVEDRTVVAGTNATGSKVVAGTSVEGTYRTMDTDGVQIHNRDRDGDGSCRYVDEDIRVVRVAL